jgi:hypothetical protein
MRHGIITLRQLTQRVEPLDLLLRGKVDGNRFWKLDAPNPLCCLLYKGLIPILAPPGILGGLLGPSQ